MATLRGGEPGHHQGPDRSWRSSAPATSLGGPVQQAEVSGDGQWVGRQVTPTANPDLPSLGAEGSAPGLRDPDTDLAFPFTVPACKGHQHPGAVPSRDKSSRPWQARISALGFLPESRPGWALHARWPGLAHCLFLNGPRAEKGFAF